MSQQLSPAQRQAIFDLLLRELRRARDAAVDGGVPHAEVTGFVDEHRELLEAGGAGAPPADEGE